MKRLQTLASCLAFCAMTALVVTSCRPASFEIVTGKKAKQTSDTGSPNKFGNGQGEPNDKDRDQDPKNDDGTSPQNPGTDGQNLPPTARVEVILNTKAVTKVKVGVPVRIQPSFDTVDPDDIGKSVCRNPGIVSADYDLDRDAGKTAERNSGCESLHIGHTFANAGEYLITMTVKSNEDETAIASMTLTVLPASADDFDLGGFTIAADPMIAKPNQTINFTAHCETETENVITWNFGDEAIAEGRITTHTYAKTGQYEIDAVCVDDLGNERDAQITIVVIDQDVVIPGKPTPGTPTPSDPDPSGGDDGDTGGSDPGQPNQGDPDQNVPDQDRKYPVQN